VALILRLAFLQSLIASFGEGRLATFSPDMRNYWESAQRIFHETRFDDETILIFGPGYPTFVAAVGAIVGMDPYRILTVQIVLSSLTGILLALLVTEITGRRTYGLIAGALYATSLLAVEIAAFMWSEAVFLLMLTTSLLLLIRGLRIGSYWYHLLSGGLLACAILTRSFGQFIPLIYITIGVTYAWPLSRTRWPVVRKQMLGALIAAAIPIIVCCGWVVRNHEVHGVSQLALASPTALSRTASLAISESRGITMKQADSTFWAEVKRHPQYAQIPHRVFIDASVAAFNEQLMTRTWPFLALLVRNCWDNITTESAPGSLPPKPRWIDKPLNLIAQIPGFEYRGVLLMGLGAAVFWRARNYKALIILLLFCAYFGVVGTFAVNQGSRIFFPAQLTGLALTAAAWVKAYEWYVARRQTRATRYIPGQPEQ
jgi:4-amino-4-deoxy-L-arabinose transferase-like glycosyltransferase